MGDGSRVHYMYYMRYMYNMHMHNMHMNNMHMLTMHMLTMHMHNMHMHMHDNICPSQISSHPTALTPSPPQPR
jgi:hypothetical protein